MKQKEVTLKMVHGKTLDLEQGLGKLGKTVNGLDRKVEGLNKKVRGLDKKADGLDKRMDRVEKRFDKVDETLKEHGEAITSLQESFEFFMEEAATKTDIKKLRETTKTDIRELSEKFATKDDIRELKDEILSHIDGFVGKYKYQDTEITSLVSGYRRHEHHIEQISKHVGLKLS